MIERPKLRWVTVFGLGHMRPASGTWGSLPPVAIGAAMVAMGLGPATHPLLWHAVLAVILVVFCLGCLAQGDEAEFRFGKKDPSQVVADETAGVCIPLMFLSDAAMGTPMSAAFTLVYAFLAFRIFDIIKPWPARQIQEAPGGWGILLDDLVAGVYAMIVVQVMSRVMM
jgi:phosphatidylglycerophosphatase A